jgi:hypothetical protein
MDEEGANVIVATFPKNNREAVCVGINEYKGKTYIFFRVYVPSLNGELTPTKDGISLGIDKCDELVKGIKALEDVMSSEKLVAQIKKNNREEIRVGLNLFKGNPLIQIRTYVAYGEDDEFLPTKKGIAMNVNLLPQLLESVDKLCEAVATLKTGEATEDV